MTSHDTHLALREERELARIEAQQEQDIADIADALWSAEPYDPSDEHDYMRDGWDL